MKHTVEQHMIPCGCRSVEECSHNDFVHLKALAACVDDFAKEMAKKLAWEARQGKQGWDDPGWQREEILEQLRQHLEKGDMVDVANFAMFAWNQEP